MPTMISIASGKGGVGKSISISNIGLALARRNIRTIIIDLDIGGADMHILFGLLSPKNSLTQFINKEVNSLEELMHPIAYQPNLSIIPGTGETLKTSNLAFQTKQKIFRHMQKLPCDVILIDVGAGTSYNVLDFFLVGQVNILISTPDLTSIMDLYRFVKVACIRKVLSSFLSYEEISKLLSDQDFVKVSEIIHFASTVSLDAKFKAERAINQIHFLLLLNRTNPNQRIYISQLKYLFKQYLNIQVPVIGEIPEDPMISKSIQQQRPIVTDDQSKTAFYYRKATNELLREISFFQSKR